MSLPRQARLCEDHSDETPRTGDFAPFPPKADPALRDSRSQ